MAITTDKTQTEPSNGESMTAEKAMNVVLEAERNARETVNQCKQEAEALLHKARQKSQRIGKRVDDRISRVHQRIARVVTDQVKRLDQEEEQLAKQDYLYRIEHDVVEVVVEQIAEMLTTSQIPETVQSYKEDEQGD